MTLNSLEDNFDTSIQTVVVQDWWSIIQNANNLYGYGIEKTNTIIPCIYKQAGYFNRFGTAWVQKTNNHWVVIDNSGKEITQNDFTIFWEAIEDGSCLSMIGRNSAVNMQTGEYIPNIATLKNQIAEKILKVL